jgi:hypothetical protein
MELIKISANPAKGFNFGYLLSIPEGPSIRVNTTLMAEMNNTGQPEDNTDAIYDKARFYLTSSRTAKMIEELNLVYFMPLFPRYKDLYTHALSRAALISDKKGLERIDKQFINMILDAKKQLIIRGINIDEKFILNGFSASGQFSNRFAVMYPELLKCVISGGQTYAILPRKEYENLKLTYPIGIQDLKELTGIKFDKTTYNSLPQFIYEGDQNDSNDTTKFSDCMTSGQANLIYAM